MWLPGSKIHSVTTYVLLSAVAIAFMAMCIISKIVLYVSLALPELILIAQQADLLASLMYITACLSLLFVIDFYQQSRILLLIIITPYLVGLICLFTASHLTLFTLGNTILIINNAMALLYLLGILWLRKGKLYFIFKCFAFTNLIPCFLMNIDGILPGFVKMGIGYLYLIPACILLSIFSHIRTQLRAGVHLVPSVRINLIAINKRKLNNGTNKSLLTVKIVEE